MQDGATGHGLASSTATRVPAGRRAAERMEFHSVTEQVAIGLPAWRARLSGLQVQLAGRW